MQKSDLGFCNDQIGQKSVFTMAQLATKLAVPKRWVFADPDLPTADEGPQPTVIGPHGGYTGSASFLKRREYQFATHRLKPGLAVPLFHSELLGGHALVVTRVLSAGVPVAASGHRRG